MISDILLKISNDEIPPKSLSSSPLSIKQGNEIKFKLQVLIKSLNSRKNIVLARGVRKDWLNKRLSNKLNSNNSLYEGLFMVGEKAKNYLHKEIPDGHPLTNIFANGIKVGEWIFEEYSKISISNNFEVEYFKNIENKYFFLVN